MKMWVIWVFGTEHYLMNISKVCKRFSEWFKDMYSNWNNLWFALLPNKFGEPSLDVFDCFGSGIFALLIQFLTTNGRNPML